MNAEIEWAPGRFYRPDCLWGGAKLIDELEAQLRTRLAA